jgi:hypothetical protein
MAGATASSGAVCRLSAPQAALAGAAKPAARCQASLASRRASGARVADAALPSRAGRCSARRGGVVAAARRDAVFSVAAPPDAPQTPRPPIEQRPRELATVAYLYDGAMP